MLARLVFWLMPMLSLWLLSGTARAEPELDPKQPVYMDAEKLGVDQINGMVVALGNVRVKQGGSVLYADRIVYYQKQNIVRADGNVRVEDAVRGETYYAEQVQLKDDLMQGVVDQFRVRMADNSQFAALQARRVSETRLELSKAVYSPCKICEGKPPFWQLKAGEVSIDDEEEKVRYEDVTMELMGVPVAYAPFFSHPTPDAKAKSGFLQPIYSQNTNLGFSVQTPYYLAIAPDKEAIITPFVTSKEGPVLIGEYRQLFNQGFLEVEASGTYPEQRDDTGLPIGSREFRGHFYATGQTALSPHWNGGFDLRRTTDDTYLRRYGFGAPRSLTSRIFTEGLYGRSFLSAEALTFQGLDANDDPDLEPYVAPLLQGYYESDPGFLGVSGMRHFSAANVQVIARQEQAQSRRLSITNGVKIPVVTDGGHLFDATLQNRVDAYSVEGVNTSQGVEDGEEVRVIPTAALKWRYPLIRASKNSSLTIEPTVLAIARPNGGNSERIPNEDNRIVELSDVNLFEIDPFPGLDTIDEGSRLAYGLSGHWWMGGKKQLYFTAGQNVSVDTETPFPYNDDGEHFSDYVGRVAFNYDPFEVSYRFRLDQEELRFNNQSIGFNMNYSPVRLDLDYITFDNDAFLEDREELVAALSVNVTDNWIVHANGRRDLLNESMLFAGGGLTYLNDCFTLDFAFNRAFVQDRDLQADTQFTVQVLLKNLTEL